MISLLVIFKKMTFQANYWHEKAKLFFANFFAKTRSQTFIASLELDLLSMNSLQKNLKILSVVIPFPGT